MNNSIPRYVFVQAKRHMPRGMRTSKDYFFFQFVIFTLILVIPLTVWMHYQLNNNTLVLSGIYCCLISTLALGMRLHGLSLNIAHTFYQANLMAVVVINVVLHGGVFSPIMVWFGILPLLPLFVQSMRWTMFWLVVTFFSIVGIYINQVSGLPVNGNLNAILQEMRISLTMYGLLTFTQLSLAVTYSTANTLTIRTIERRNTRLQSLSVQLRQANAHKDKFLATVSHELRTPLNAVMGHLGLMTSDPKLEGELQDHAQQAHGASEHLLTVINDLLDYSQIQQGKLVLNPQAIDLHRTLSSAHQTLLPRAVDKGLDYTLNIAPNVPRYAKLDPHRLTQILLNLLGNAVKFTSKGSIHLSVGYELDPTQPKQGQLLIQIQDTGPGISKSDQRRIFEPFIQLQQAYDIHAPQPSALKGNGLGLSITRSLIQNWHGHLSLHSDLGRGTRFEVSLPIEQSHEVADTEKSMSLRVLPDQLHLLLVDDHHVNRLVARATIARSLPNVVTDEAINGQDAFEKMSKRLYDLVLMDLIMPDLSGTEVVQKVRAELPEPYRSVNVVAFTANVSQDAVKECKAVGIHSLLPKPFHVDALINTIRQYAKTS